MHRNIKIIDCTLRDGGYYNAWDFEPDLVTAYLEAMAALKIDYVEIGLRSKKNSGFKGGFAYTTDNFLGSLNIPNELEYKIGVMVNASELVCYSTNRIRNIDALFVEKSNSPVSLVRIACHVHEFEKALPAALWLKNHGYKVGFNLMQIADRSKEEIVELSEKASKYPIDTLYFADSMGSITRKQVKIIVESIKKAWDGDIGIHAHDNMTHAVQNSVSAAHLGVTWIDSTVTGMGRGPGNAQTEYIAIALDSFRKESGNITKLLEVIRKYFKPLQEKHNWGTNPYYYLAGKYGIHPTYIQQMLTDNRFNEEDILSAIEHLKVDGGKKYSADNLNVARNFYSGKAKGTWNPNKMFRGKEILLLGSGPGVEKHRQAIENYIASTRPIVLALNTQSGISQELIDVRIACQPVRLLADCEAHVRLPQPLITPASMLPIEVIKSLAGKILYDYGLIVKENNFYFNNTYCTIPTSLVIAYALAVLSSGGAKKIYLAGFDGYGSDDPRRKEIDDILALYNSSSKVAPLVSITPTLYDLEILSIYGL